MTTTESVWDYPRPPRLEKSTRRVTIEFGGRLIADTTRAIRVLETSHPPGWYLPAQDIDLSCLAPHPRQTFCEYKGVATYWDVRVDDRVARAAAWSYPEPTPGYEPILNHLSFYAYAMDTCRVDEEVVVAQAGDFYGGWVTSDVTGPFKGGPVG